MCDGRKSRPEDEEGIDFSCSNLGGIAHLFDVRVRSMLNFAPYSIECAPNLIIQKDASLATVSPILGDAVGVLSVEQDNS
jgi:hypothetical protein